MKIEMGESLFYSWLRHVKNCQIVQTNWKVSSSWEFNNNEEIKQMYNDLDKYFQDSYNYKIFKQNASLQQIIRQGECDVLGINVEEEKSNYYAVDVAFHESGLNYGSNDETICKIIAKTIRTIFCIYGYLGAKNGEIVFASPKINDKIAGETAEIQDILIVSCSFIVLFGLRFPRVKIQRVKPNTKIMIELIPPIRDNIIIVLLILVTE